jgi:hypothetical protein
MPALGGHAKTSVEKSLDPAYNSAYATGPPAVYDPVVLVTCLLPRRGPRNR